MDGHSARTTAFWYNVSLGRSRLPFHELQGPSTPDEPSWIRSRSVQAEYGREPEWKGCISPTKTQAQNVDGGCGQYSRFVSNALPGRPPGQRSADYPACPDAARRIADVLRDIPLIWQLCNPGDRANFQLGCRTAAGPRMVPAASDALFHAQVARAAAPPFGVLRHLHVGKIGAFTD